LLHPRIRHHDYHPVDSGPHRCGRRRRPGDVRIENVLDGRIIEPTDALVAVTRDRHRATRRSLEGWMESPKGRGFTGSRCCRFSGGDGWVGSDLGATAANGKGHRQSRVKVFSVLPG
jgi:hypothetical protein